MYVTDDTNVLYVWFEFGWITAGPVRQRRFMVVGAAHAIGSTMRNVSFLVIMSVLSCLVDFERNDASVASWNIIRVRSFIY